MILSQKYTRFLLAPLRFVQAGNAERCLHAEINDVEVECTLLDLRMLIQFHLSGPFLRDLR